VHTIIAREKAKMLALGGVEVARSQLAYQSKKDNKKSDEKQAQLKNLPKSNQTKEIHKKRQPRLC
jgi:hypothetical protein